MDYSDPQFWFSPKGRVNRRPYFFGGLAVACFTEGLELIPSNYKIMYLPLVLAALYAGTVLGIKRCHDRGRTGYFILLNFIPILNLWPMIELGFFKGEAGSNKYGVDPLENLQQPYPLSPSGSR